MTHIYQSFEPASELLPCRSSPDPKPKPKGLLDTSLASPAGMDILQSD